MKATITRNGCLTITPETEMELYALVKWRDDFHLGNCCKSTLMIRTDLPTGLEEASFDRPA